MRTFRFLAHVILMSFALPVYAQGTSSNSDLNSLMAQGDGAAVVRALDNDGLPVDADIAALMHMAAAAGDLSVLAALVDAGVDIDIREPRLAWTPLMTAIHHGQSPAARWLLVKGSDRDTAGKDGLTPDMLTAFGEVALSRRTRAQPNYDQEWLDNIALMAVEAGDLQLLREMIDLGAELAAPDGVHWTALEYAAYHGEPELFRTVLEHTTTYREQLEADPRRLYLGFAPRITVPMAAVMGIARRKPSDDEAFSFLLLVRQSHDLNESAVMTGPTGLLARGLGLSQLLWSLFGNPAPLDLGPIPPLSKDMSKEDWIGLQTRLSELGLYNSALDGIPGPGTRSALHGWIAGALSAVESAGRALCESTPRPKVSEFQREYGPFSTAEQKSRSQTFFVVPASNGYQLRIFREDFAFGPLSEDGQLRCTISSEGELADVVYSTNEAAFSLSSPSSCASPLHESIGVFRSVSISVGGENVFYANYCNGWANFNGQQLIARN